MTRGTGTGSYDGGRATVTSSASATTSSTPSTASTTATGGGRRRVDPAGGGSFVAVGLVEVVADGAVVDGAVVEDRDGVGGADPGDRGAGASPDGS